MKKPRNSWITKLLIGCCLFLSSMASALPLASDSRIKTFVYSENEVFRVTVLYGYQANMEFGLGEEVETISMGSAYAWQITPTGRRVFIKPIEPAARTNMTLITNKRTYQFELVSKLEEDAKEEEQVYVVRFYYPDVNFDRPRSSVAPSGMGVVPRQGGGISTLSAQGVENTIPASPAVKKANGAMHMPKNSAAGEYRYHYTFVGPERVAPQKIFDDGRATYFQFANQNAAIPHIFSVQEGKEQRLSYSLKGDYVLVQGVYPQFTLKMGKDTVCVFNEENAALKNAALNVSPLMNKK